MYTFIVNPVAGRGKPIKCMEKASEYLNHQQIPFKVLYTEFPGHATDLVKGLYLDEMIAVVAVGGDGTVAEVAEGLMGTNTPIGIVPSGTGNDYRRSLDITDDTMSAIDIILQNNIRKADTVKINGRNFLNITTVGLDVEVVRRAAHYKIFGAASYTLAAIEAAFFAKPNRATFVIDGKTEDKEFLLFAAGCGAYYGGGMNPLPGATPFDGMLSICMIDVISSLKILSLLPKYKVGAHANLKVAHFSKAKNIKIVSEVPMFVNADGEILPEITELEYQIVPQNLNVLVSYTGE
ncbi:MAG: diacylglycerol kinase family lipid kinase [Clostridiales bacterium]|nr:diacylglycerol kinase family lipid kinase [Clostridiales bacterium]